MRLIDPGDELDGLSPHTTGTAAPGAEAPSYQSAGTLKRLVSAGPDPFREFADNYTRLSDEYTAYVLRTRAVIRSARWVVAAEEEDEGGEWDLAHEELRKSVEALDDAD